MNIVQIGANRGDDDLSLLIKLIPITKLILVEPMKLHNDALISYYNWVENKFIENVVIDVNSNEDVEFFYHENDGPYYELSSLDKNHFYPRHEHVKSNDGIKSFFIKSMNINDLFIKHDLSVIHKLFIDAEGHDENIIKSIDFNRFKIHQLFFENLHIKDKTIYSFLEDKDYEIHHNIGHNGWTTLATIFKKLNIVRK